MKTFTQKLTRFLASKTFFYIIIGFFVFEALWFVFSAMYPMAFDENYHFGLVQLYAQHLSPFWSEQPAGADKFGAVVRDPSFFYHYLMSFPYRFIDLFTNSETIQVIFLRLINVAIFAWGLVLFRKVMLRAKASPMLANATLAIYALIPIVPFLAAHVNYDNIFMVLLPLLCLNGFTIIEGLQAKRLELKAVIWFAVLGMASCVVKYPALPIVVAGFVFLAVMFFRAYRARGKYFMPDVKKAFGAFTVPQKYVLLGLTLLFAVFFVQRYGVNMALYKTPVPDCDQVLTVEQCSQYGPWARDHGYVQDLSDDWKPSLVTFTGSWFGGMIHRMFFAINANYTNYLELPLPTYTAGTLAVLGFVALIIWWRAVFRGNTLLAFCITLAFGYIAVLFVNGYMDYARVGRPVAINGRYLLPVLPLLAIALGRGIALTLGKFKAQKAKPYLAVGVILLFLHGGGVFTFILRSDKTWYWPNQAVVNVNEAVRDVLAPVTIEGPKQRP
ncbi:MAG TPA: hypothetical protein VFT16_00795 [Candidatus Saccharimonadales bacterium]|nr:hypothetical protein [Candidatus Saccharimonadales bacterium]